MRVLYYEGNNPERKVITEFDDVMYNSMVKEIIFKDFHKGYVTVYAHISEKKNRQHYFLLDYDTVLKILLINGYIDLTEEFIRDPICTDRYYYNNLDIQAVYHR